MSTDASEDGSVHSFMDPSSSHIKHPCELILIFLVDGNKVLFKYPRQRNQDILGSRQKPHQPTNKFHSLYYSETFKDSDDAAFECASDPPNVQDQILSLRDEDIVFLTKCLGSSKDHTARVDNLYFLSQLIRPSKPRVAHCDIKIKFGSTETTIEFVSIGVILNASLTSEWIIQSYKELLSTISAVMWFEERRNNYIGEQVVEMHTLYDTSRASNVGATTPVSGIDASFTSLSEEAFEEEEKYQELLKSSGLASFIKQVFDQIVSRAEVKVALNGWLQVSHCFPHRSVSCQAINCWALLDAIRNPSKYIKPFHSIILLTENGMNDDKPALNILPNDCVKDLFQFMRAVTPSQSLAQTAVEMNLTLDQVTTFVAHLLYWRRAKLIYPLNQKSMLTTTLNVNRLQANVSEFNKKFPGQSLISELLDFEQLICLGDRLAVKHNGTEKQEFLAMVEWMLARDIICQVHKYVFLVPEVKNEFVSDYRKLLFGICDSDYSKSGVVFSGIDSSEDESGFRLTTQETQIVNTALSKTTNEVKQLFERLKKYANGRFNVDQIAFNEKISVYDVGTVLFALPEILLTADFRDPNPLMQI